MLPVLSLDFATAEVYCHIILTSAPKLIRHGFTENTPDRMARMSRAFVSHFGRSKGIWTSQVQTLVESNQGLKNLYLSLSSQAFGINRIGQEQVGSVSGHGVDRWVSQWAEQ